MAYHLFDRPNLGIIIAIILETVILLSLVFAPTRVKKLWLLAGPGLVMLIFALDWLVESNRESLERLTRQVVRAVQDENAGGVIELISDNFLHDSGLQKTEVAVIIEQRLNKPIIEKNKITKLMVIDALPKSGRVEFSVITIIDRKSSYAIVPLVKSSWRFDFIRDSDDQYRLRNITNLSFNKGPAINIFRYRPKL